ncbi:hypothetical protein BpHYR1_014257 [Brachionus plicatilis]|uniref:Uncharacterized protein n=1 Tax=Brachionus plicatilis TaxID=10195 RepID=A0A3M7SVP1_BRAPC|nr:hypothetical protein BpHYR1_014257 [Brachionus plicatilis]
MNLGKEKNSLRLIRLKIYINFLRSLISSTKSNLIPRNLISFWLTILFPYIFKFRLSLSFLYLEKTTEHDFSTDILIFHLTSHSSSSLVPLFVINEECN